MQCTQSSWKKSHICDTLRGQLLDRGCSIRTRMSTLQTPSRRIRCALNASGIVLNELVRRDLFRRSLENRPTDQRCLFCCPRKLAVDRQQNGRLGREILYHACWQ